MRRSLLPGYLFAAGAAVCYAVGQVTSRMVVREVGSPLAVSLFSFLFGTFFLLLLFLPQFSRDFKRENRPRGLIFFAANGIAGSLGVVAIMYALRYSPVAVVASVSGIQPLFALLFSYLFLQHLERITLGMLLGTLLVVGGVVLIALSQI